MLDDLDLTVCTTGAGSSQIQPDVDSRLSLDPNQVLDTVSWPEPYGGAEVNRSTFDRDLVQGRQIDIGKLSR